MNEATAAHDPVPERTITLEIVPDRSDELDLAVTNALGCAVVDAAQREGYLARLPATPTPTRGGVAFLIELVQQVLASTPQVERVLTDASSLVTILTGTTPILRALFRAHQTHTNPHSGPITVSLEIDGKPISVEAADLEQLDAALKLAQKYSRAHPTAARAVTPHSTTAIKATLPKQHRRRRT